MEKFKALLNAAFRVVYLLGAVVLTKFAEPYIHIFGFACIVLSAVGVITAIVVAALLYR